MVLWKDTPRRILAITFSCDDQLPVSILYLLDYTLRIGALGKKINFWTCTRKQCERTALVDYVVSLALNSI